MVRIRIIPLYPEKPILVVSQDDRLKHVMTRTRMALKLLPGDELLVRLLFKGDEYLDPRVLERETHLVELAKQTDPLLEIFVMPSREIPQGVMMFQ